MTNYWTRHEREDLRAMMDAYESEPSHETEYPVTYAEARKALVTVEALEAGNQDAREALADAHITFSHPELSACECTIAVAFRHLAALEGKPPALGELDCVEGDGRRASHLHGGNSGLEPCCGEHDDCLEGKP